MTRNPNVLDDLPHGRFISFIFMETYICFFTIWFMELFSFLYIRVEDALIELYLAGSNQHSNYTASGVDNQDYQMLSANGLCLG